MSKKKKSTNARGPMRAIIVSIIVTLLAVAGIAALLWGRSIDVFDPQGVIADQQVSLIVLTVILGAIVIVPVFILLFTFSWKYRDGKGSKYAPDYDTNHAMEAVWWGIPVLIIAILCVVTWITTHQLDPYRPLDTSDRKERVQVVALQWRWLFIYPEHGIATINDLRFPAQTDVRFLISADGPMAAFWVPKLGSQIYAMNGMTSQLHLQAHRPGVYRGMNTNITGEGYADMDLKTTVTTEEEFEEWMHEVHGSGETLDWQTYQTLAEATRDRTIRHYHLGDKDLYDKILHKYMPDHHSGDSNTSHETEHGEAH